MSPLSFTVLMLFALLLHQLHISNGKLVQIQVVHRHGARAHLRKNSTSPGQESGPPLLEEGYEQGKLLGSYIRQRYSKELTGFEEKYTSGIDIRAISSNLERTLSTSRGFLEGLFPKDSGRISTFVFGDTEDDYRLRGYTLCRKYKENLIKFYRSKEFKSKETETKDLREKYANMLEEDSALKNWFNVYDRIFLKEKGYDNAGVGFDIKDDDFENIEKLASWLEFRRYGPEVAGNLVGGGLLGEMLNRAEQYNDGKKETDHRIIEYSAHYPTILGLLSAIGIGIESMSNIFDERIPDFTAAIIWEIHDDGPSRRSIKMLYFPGGTAIEGQSPKFIFLPFGFRKCADKEKRCPLPTIKSSASKNMSASEFCKMCFSDISKEPGFCFKNLANAVSASRNCNSAKAGAIGGLIGVAIASVILLGYITWLSRKKRQRMFSQAAWVPQDGGDDAYFSNSPTLQP